MPNIAAWNVRSLLDNPRSNRPEQRTVLVARELALYKVDSAALSETDSLSRVSCRRWVPTTPSPGAAGQRQMEHRPVILKMRLRQQPHRRPQGKQRHGKLNTVLLNAPAHQLYFSNELANHLVNLPVADADISVENRWCRLRDTIQSTALDVLGHTRRQHQDWFDEKDRATNALLVEKNQLHKAYVDRPTAANKTAFYRSRRLVQQRLRQMQDAWMTRKAEEIQEYAVYGPPVKSIAPLLSADGRTLLIGKTQILTRWAEHFQSVLNQPSTISDAAIDRLPEV
ncbi:unnamed protein product [Schistocephalus solidus]|uniref:Uncharacterized protein n=1 Tax=Schistocephalus solidus TaxID=70667 RepID=A0A3P7D1U1_SCHSO|nr:unnamed protein product [Schistocephalus solidus]